MTRTPRRVLAPEDRRAELVAAARGVFAARGFHDASVAAIVEAVGCSRGTFYNYFDSKRDVFAVVVDDLVDEVLSVVRPIDVTTEVLPQVQANLARLVRALMADDMARVLFGAAAGVDADGDAALIAFYGTATARIAAALQTGQRLGIVREGDVTWRARLLLGLFKEPVFQARLRGEPVDVESVVDEILGVMVGGVLG